MNDDALKPIVTIGSLESYDCRMFLYKKTEKNSIVIEGGSPEIQQYAMSIIESFMEKETGFFNAYKIVIQMLKMPPVWALLGRLHALITFASEIEGN